jgi:hypothetical protein
MFIHFSLRLLHLLEISNTLKDSEKTVLNEK